MCSLQYRTVKFTKVYGKAITRNHGILQTSSRGIG